MKDSPGTQLGGPRARPSGGHKQSPCPPGLAPPACGPILLRALPGRFCICLSLPPEDSALTVGGPGLGAQWALSPPLCSPEDTHGQMSPLWCLPCPHPITTAMLPTGASRGCAPGGPAACVRACERACARVRYAHVHTCTGAWCMKCRGCVRAVLGRGQCWGALPLSLFLSTASSTASPRLHRTEQSRPLLPDPITQGCPHPSAGPLRLP